MYSRTTKIVNLLGLHARPASALTLKAKQFEAEITIRSINAQTEKHADVKSVLQLMAACIAVGTVVEIRAEGVDEQRAVDELVALIDTGFLEKRAQA